ncbi:hypothetical protein MRX96_027982 [Rhipicephalus microplus]
MEAKRGGCLQYHIQFSVQLTAWWLLRSLQHRPAICQPILAMANSLDLLELTLVDLMASQNCNETTKTTTRGPAF